jgi:hypothetical protein
MQFSSASSSFLPLRPTYSPQNHVPNHPQYIVVQVLTAVAMNNSIFCDTITANSSLYPLLSQVKVTLRLTVSLSVCLGVKPLLGPKTRFLLLSEICGFVNVRGRL